MLVWRSETHGGATADWFNWDAKWRWVKMALRDRWQRWDEASLVLCAAVFLLAVFSRKLSFSRNLFFSAMVLIAGYLLLPRIIFGSAYADMRLVPYAIAVILLAIRFKTSLPSKLASGLAAAGLLFCIARIGGTTASLAIAANDQQAKLAALDHIPMGAIVATLVGDPCTYFWPLPRNSHLGAMVVVRKQGFSNDQWVMEGLNLLDLRYRPAGHFASDPSQRVRRTGCGIGPLWTIDHALSALPTQSFDYVWLVDPPPFDRSLTAGMQQVWRGPGSVLYRLH